MLMKSFWIVIIIALFAGYGCQENPVSQQGDLGKISETQTWETYLKQGKITKKILDKSASDMCIAYSCDPDVPWDVFQQYIEHTESNIPRSEKKILDNPEDGSTTWPKPKEDQYHEYKPRKWPGLPNRNISVRAMAFLDLYKFKEQGSSNFVVRRIDYVPRWDPRLKRYFNSKGEIIYRPARNSLEPAKVNMKLSQEWTFVSTQYTLSASIGGGGSSINITKNIGKIVGGKYQSPLTLATSISFPYEGLSVATLQKHDGKINNLIDSATGFFKDDQARQISLTATARKYY